MITPEIEEEVLGYLGVPAGCFRLREAGGFLCFEQQRSEGPGTFAPVLSLPHFWRERVYDAGLWKGHHTGWGQPMAIVIQAERLADTRTGPPSFRSIWLWHREDVTPTPTGSSYTRRMVRKNCLVGVSMGGVLYCSNSGMTHVTEAAEKQTAKLLGVEL